MHTKFDTYVLIVAAESGAQSDKILNKSSFMCNHEAIDQENNPSTSDSDSNFTWRQKKTIEYQKHGINLNFLMTRTKRERNMHGKLSLIVVPAVKYHRSRWDTFI